LTILVRKTASIAHQTAGRGELAKHEDRGPAKTGRRR
jgi:hypothetical protein